MAATLIYSKAIFGQAIRVFVGPGNLSIYPTPTGWALVGGGSYSHASVGEWSIWAERQLNSCYNSDGFGSGMPSGSAVDGSVTVSGSTGSSTVHAATVAYDIAGAASAFTEHDGPTSWSDTYFAGTTPSSKKLTGTVSYVAPLGPCISVGCPSIHGIGVITGGSTGVPISGYIYSIGPNVPMTLTISAGSLPPGLSIGTWDAASSEAPFTGTPTTHGSYSFTIRASGSDGLYNENNCSMTISGEDIPPEPTTGKKTRSMWYTIG